MGQELPVAASGEPQKFSFFPAIPPPPGVPLRRSLPHPCSYFPERDSEIRQLLVEGMPPELYQRLMDCGFRRSGKLIYQPVCSGCRRCIPIRVPVETFTPSKSQRRCWNKNQDLQIAVGKPALTDEKFALYTRYLKGWHGRGAEGASGRPESTREELEEFLYESPVQSLEFEYRDQTRRLIAVGICDVSPLESLSSVYFYFDPADAKHSLGTYGAMVEIEAARKWELKYYYLGYWIEGCSTMNYKSSYRPFELLDGDGVWRAGDAPLTDK